MSHKQFTLHDRERIAQLFTRGDSPTRIAAKIGKHPCSVRRELARNRHDDGHYYPAHAHTLSAGRRAAAKRRSAKIQHRPKLQAAIVKKLIGQRPTEADDRRRPGDWESDTLEGKAHKSYLATHVERTSQYLVMARLVNKKSSTFNARSARAFRGHDRRGHPWPRLTLTADNGKEFTDHPDPARRLKVDVYFANAYHP